MKILHAIQEMRVGGAERLMISLLDAHRGRGHEVAVVAADGPLSGELPGPRFDLRMIERRPWRVVGAGRDIARAIREFGPDVVHAHNPLVGLATGLATRRGRSTPAIVSHHGCHPDEYARAARLFALAGLPVVACGPGAAAGLTEAGARKVTVICNGVSPAPPPYDRPTISSLFGVPVEGPLLVAVGRLEEQKNHRVAVAAMADIPGAHLVIAGSGPLQEELVAQAESGGVADRVHLIGARPDARSVLGGADVALLPSVWEGLPLVGLEALAAGVPLVAGRVRGIEEMLIDGRYAVLVDHLRPEELARGVIALLGDPDRRSSLVAEGRSLAAGLSLEATAEGFETLYRRMAAGAPGR